jgi:hypothetical protein
MHSFTDMRRNKPVKKSLSQEQEDQNKGCLVGAIGIFIMTIALMIWYNVNKDDIIQQHKHDRLEALINSREFVKDRLKAPGTAEFSTNENDAVMIDENNYYIHSWVDAENSFGAKLRSNYKCKIVFNGDKTRCEDLQITQR